MASLEESNPKSESENQNQLLNSNVKNNSLLMDDQVNESQVQLREKENGIEVEETKIFNSSLQEPDTSGDWYEDNKWNLNSILNENDEVKSTWKSRNVYSMPNSKFQAYWKDRFSDSIIREFNSETSDLKTEEPNLLSNFRDFIATYQEANGTPATEFSFVALIKVLAEAVGKSLLALIYIIVNMAPMIEIFLYILRFFLDKLINIRAAEDYRQMIIKSVIFVIQSLCIYICLIFIFGFILMPIVRLVFDIMTRVLFFNL